METLSFASKQSQVKILKVVLKYPMEGMVTVEEAGMKARMGRNKRDFR